MQNKGKMTLLSILACTSLMSVGFSAWTVQGGNEEIVNGTIYIDGIESKTYISRKSEKELKYSIEDFIVEYQDPSNIGPSAMPKVYNDLGMSFNVDIDSCLEDFPYTTSIDLQIRLSYSDAVIARLEELEENGRIDSVSSYYDFFNDDYLYHADFNDSYESKQLGNNEYLLERELLLERGISQLTFRIYDEEASYRNALGRFNCESLLQKFENPSNEEQNKMNAMHAKYFGWEVLETSPLLFDIGNDARFKFEATLVIRTGGDL